MVISWLASLLGLTLWFIDEPVNENRKKLLKKVTFDKYGIKKELIDQIKRLMRILEFDNFSILTKTTVKMFWLPFNFQEKKNKIERFGKFVSKKKLEFFIKKALDKFKTEMR